MKPMRFARATYLALAGLLVTACTSSVPTATTVGVKPGASTVVRISASPLPASDVRKSDLARVAVAPAAPRTPLRPARTPQFPTGGCPILIENPVGCPVPQPGPNLPPLRQARIALCPPAVLGSVRPVLALCGMGFRPSEVVVITVVGSVGRLAFQTTAGANGSFDFPLPPSACVIAPHWIRAQGNRGTVSNELNVPLYACIMR